MDTAAALLDDFDKIFDVSYMFVRRAHIQQSRTDLFSNGLELVVRHNFIDVDPLDLYLEMIDVVHFSIVSTDRLSTAAMVPYSILRLLEI